MCECRRDASPHLPPHLSDCAHSDGKFTPPSTCPGSPKQTLLITKEGDNKWVLAKKTFSQAGHRDNDGSNLRGGDWHLGASQVAGWVGLRKAIMSSHVT